jgi:phosphatidylglycerophosphatase C
MATAIFDLDRTVTRLATWTRFVFFAGGLRPGFLIRLPILMWHGVAVVLGLADRQAYKRYSLTLLAALPLREVEARAEAFVAREVAQGLRPGAVDAIRHHKTRGDRVILATACVDMLAALFGRHLGLDDVVSTHLAAPVGERLVPIISGANCDGREKLLRVKALDHAHPFTRPVYAYSDHVSDLGLLEWADRGFAVNPSRRLRLAARHSPVRVVDFERRLPTLDALPD